MTGDLRTAPLNDGRHRSDDETCSQSARVVGIRLSLNDGRHRSDDETICKLRQIHCNCPTLNDGRHRSDDEIYRRQPLKAPLWSANDGHRSDDGVRLSAVDACPPSPWPLNDGRHRSDDETSMPSRRSDPASPSTLNMVVTEVTTKHCCVVSAVVDGELLRSTMVVTEVTTKHCKEEGYGLAAPTLNDGRHRSDDETPHQRSQSACGCAQRWSSLK